MNEKECKATNEQKNVSAISKTNCEEMSSKDGDFVVTLDGVSFSYGENEKPALKNLSLKVKRGEYVAILGHNGSGKSTLARLINGLLSPTVGKISVFGMDAGDKKNLFEIRKNVGIVFQNPDNQTVASIVEDDVAFGPENIGVPREEIGERIDFALKTVGMEKYRHAEAAKLSGGQKQRIAIAGVLALKPQIMILDESTAMLDPKGRREVMQVVKKLNREEGITILSITHFPEEAMLADRAIILNRGECVAEGMPEEVLKDEDKLLTYNLTLPKSVKICRDLRRHGIDIPDSLHAEEIAEKILKYVQTSDEGECAKNILTEKNDTAPLAIQCKNLSFTYEEAKEPALCGVNIEVKEGEFFGIIGHTGSGKSTFVRHLNALEKLPTAQKKYKEKRHKKGAEQPETILAVNGYDLTNKKTDFFALRHDVGMVFQYPEYQLFAETVFDDVAFGLKNFSKEKLSQKEIETAVREAIEKTGLSYAEVKNKSPFELSGGQKRRVAIAGVIVTKPKILVLDEPAAGLDPLGKEEIATLLKNVHKDWCKTIIVVSHDMDEIAEECNRAAVFSQGKVVLCDTPQKLFTENAEELFSLGLDIPTTAKIQRELALRGVKIQSDLTETDFVAAVVNKCGKEYRQDAIEMQEEESNG